MDWVHQDTQAQIRVNIKIDSFLQFFVDIRFFLSLSSIEETFDYKDIWKFWIKIWMYKFSNFLIKCSFLRHFYGQYYKPLKSHRRQTTSTTIPIDFGFLLCWSFRLTNTVNMTMIFGCAPAIWPIIALHRMIWPGLFTTFAMIPNGRVDREEVGSIVAQNAFLKFIIIASA